MTTEKKQNLPSKPRQKCVYSRTKGEVSELGFSFDPATGELEFLYDAIDTYTEVSYSRTKGEKILIRIPSKSTLHTFESNRLLFRDYAALFAVDTTTAFINGIEFSATSVVNVKFFFTVDSNGIATKEQDVFYYGVPFSFVCRPPEGNPETLGWCLLIEELRSSNAYRRCRSVGIVVDSELGRLNDINARRAPIRDQLMLPAGITLIYASDAAAETAANHLMRVADATATQVRHEVLAGRIPVPSSQVTGPPFKGYRKILGLNSTVL